MTFRCSTHRAFIYHLGGIDLFAELPVISHVRWTRVRDDISTAEVTVPTSECCEILADLRTIEHELHIWRDDKVVWQGPVIRVEHEEDLTQLFAEDILWQAKRAVIEEGYDQSYPNIWNVIDRMNWLLHHCYGRHGDPWNVVSRIRPIYGPSDPSTTRIVFAWQMYVWDDLDTYASRYGADYTVYNRDIYFFDAQLRWLVLPPLDTSHMTRPPRLVEYGNELGTRGIVTNGRGFAGVSAITPGSLAHYSTVVDWLTTNEIDGQPGLEGEPPLADPNVQPIPTTEELASWTNTATRSIASRFPSPVAVFVPDNTTLLPTAPWQVEDLVPGAWFEISAPHLCRTVTQWQRIETVTVIEEEHEGESVQFTAVAAPLDVVLPIGVLPTPPGTPPPPVVVPPTPTPTCVNVLNENFTNVVRWTGSITSVAGGRTGNAGQVSGSGTGVYHIATAQSEYLMIGVAYEVSTVGGINRMILQLRAGPTGENLNTLHVTPAGALSVLGGDSGGTVIATSSDGLIVAGIWSYLELQIRHHDTLGSITVRKDGVTVITATGVGTRFSATEAEYDAVALQGAGTSQVALYDDLYLRTGSGCTLLGDPNPPPPPVLCADVLTEPFNDFTTNGWVTPAGRDAPTIVTGRTGTCARIAQFSTTQYNFTADASDTVTVGFAYRASAVSNTPQVFFLSSDAGTLIHFQMMVLTTGALRATRYSVTTLGTSAAGTIVPNVWYYIEVQVRVHDTAGFLIVRVDGTEVINVSGVDTRNSTGTTPLDQLMLQSNSFGSTHDYDDLYLSTGADCEFQGDPTL